MGVKKFALGNLWKQPNLKQLSLICIDVRSVAWRGLCFCFLSETKCEMALGNRVAKTTDKPGIQLSWLAPVLQPATTSKHGREHYASIWMDDEQMRPQCSRKYFLKLSFFWLVLTFASSFFSNQFQFSWRFYGKSLIGKNICSWCSYKDWTRDVRRSGDNQRFHMPQATPLVTNENRFFFFFKGRQTVLFFFLLRESKIDYCAVNQLSVEGDAEY